MIYTAAKLGKSATGKTAQEYLAAVHDSKGVVRAGIELLEGNPNYVTSVIDSLTFKHTYTSSVIAFHKDDNPTKEQIREALDEFIKHAFAGLDESQYTYYAVQHIEDDGTVHIHIIAPKVDLVSGKSLNIMPPGWLNYFRPQRDYMNLKHGWKNPEADSQKQSVKIGQQDDKVASIMADGRRKTVKERKENISDIVMQSVKGGTVKSRSDVLNLLRDRGCEITRTHAKSISIKEEDLPENGRAIKLEGSLFEQDLDVKSILSKDIDDPLDCETEEALYYDEKLGDIKAEQDRAFVKRATYNQKNHPTKNIKNIEKGKYEMSNPITMSITDDPRFHSKYGWKKVKIASWSVLANTMNKYDYSVAHFNEKGRNTENIESFGACIILDVDNDKYDPQLTMDEAITKLEDANVVGLVMPTKSHLKPKLVSKEQQEKHGDEVKEEYHIAERFRIFVPTVGNLPKGVAKDMYRRFMSSAVSALGLSDYIDTGASVDMARKYAPSKLKELYFKIAKGTSRFNITNIWDRALEMVSQERIDAQKRIKEFKVRQSAPIDLSTTLNQLILTDVEAINSYPISDVIASCEVVEEKTISRYKYHVTDTKKYSIIEKDNIAHDFKSGETYNNFTYLKEILNTNHIQEIAKRMEIISGETFNKVNIYAINESIKKALKTAINDRTFEDSIKATFGVEYCSFDNNKLTIAGENVYYSDINMTYRDIVETLIANRGDGTGGENKTQEKEEIPSNRMNTKRGISR
jgi:hypothetical protein